MVTAKYFKVVFIYFFLTSLELFSVFAKGLLFHVPLSI